MVDGLHVTVAEKEKFHQAIWAGCERVSVRFGDHPDKLHTGFSELASKDPSLSRERSQVRQSFNCYVLQWCGCGSHVYSLRAWKQKCHDSLCQCCHNSRLLNSRLIIICFFVFFFWNLQQKNKWNYLANMSLCLAVSKQLAPHCNQFFNHIN